MVGDWALERAAQAWCQDATKNTVMDVALAEAFAEILDTHCSELDRLRVQLAGCLTVAEGATSDPAHRSDYGWSPAYQAVLELRRRFDSQKILLDAYRKHHETFHSDCNIAGRREQRPQP